MTADDHAALVAELRAAMPRAAFERAVKAGAHMHPGAIVLAKQVDDAKP